MQFNASINKIPRYYFISASCLDPVRSLDYLASFKDDICACVGCDSVCIFLRNSMQRKLAEIFGGLYLQQIQILLRRGGNL